MSSVTCIVLSPIHALAQGEVDGNFVDPDTFMLTAVGVLCETAGVEDTCRVSPEVVIDKIRGEGDELSAPDWAKWPIDTPREMWREREHVAQVFMQAALHERNCSEVRLRATK